MTGNSPGLFADGQFADGQFADGKEPAALRTIGEVAAGLGIRQHVLRYWEQQFPTLRPLKRSGGRRYYRPADVQLVATIHRLVNSEGYTLKGARLAVERMQPADATAAGPAEHFPPDPGPRDTARAFPPQPGGDAQAVNLLPQLRAIRERLAAALDS